MLIKASSAANYGINTIGVDVEVNVASRGFPTFDIVGLPSKAVAESKDRVKTALINSDFDFPNRKITVNLAPADLPKEGSFYDLPISVGIMASITDINIKDNALYYGELSLDGSLRHTKGSLLVSIFAKEHGFKKVYVPYSCAKEAAVIEGVRVYGVKTLNELYEHLTGATQLKPVEVVTMGNEQVYQSHLYNMSDVLGQQQAKRVLEIAIAGGHNVLMVGPPGGGKTMLAKTLPTILPPLTFEESLEVTKIYSAAGNIAPNKSLITTRQTRSPHHTISYAGMIGGGTFPKPGVISLAHRGVLFLDELAEFPRHVLESLRQPIEDGEVTIARSHGSVTFPCRFIMIAASNPCPCGYLNHPKVSCNCTQYQVIRYNKKISGPLLDRMDLYVEVNALATEELTINSKGDNNEKSESIRNRIIKSRLIQEKRLKSENIYSNADRLGYE